jgi:hypothetical protein
MRRKGARTSASVGSAARADVDQAIKPTVILLDPLRQSVVAAAGLPNQLLLAHPHWWPMAYESLHVSVFLRMGGVYNGCRR